MRRGYEFNYPLLVAPGTTATPVSFLSVERGNVIVEVVKKADEPLRKTSENAEKQVVLRVWEINGGRGVADLHVNLPIIAAQRSDSDQVFLFLLFIKVLINLSVANESILQGECVGRAGVRQECDSRRPARLVRVSAV